MPRLTRIQYENAFYHVINRGRGRQRIFHGEEYFQDFLQTLGESHSRFDAQIHAYCLMQNHYHLIVETPRANLDRIMRHINGVYTQRYNRRKKTDGPLFRGRYKAILVDEDAYLLQLGRYVHRNPAEVKGARESVLKTYAWSSYPAYINKVQSPTWLVREKTYQMLGSKQRYAGYAAYVARGNDELFTQHYSKGNTASVLGDKAFKERISNKRDTLRVSGDLSKALSDRPSATAVIEAVGRVFNVPSASIVDTQRSLNGTNIPRRFAIYCCQHLGDLSLKEIAGVFGLNHPGSVSPSVALIKGKLLDGELALQHRQVCKMLNIIK